MGRVERVPDSILMPVISLRSEEPGQHLRSCKMDGYNLWIQLSALSRLRQEKCNEQSLETVQTKFPSIS